MYDYHVYIHNNKSMIKKNEDDNLVYDINKFIKLDIKYLHEIRVIKRTLMSLFHKCCSLNIISNKYDYTNLIGQKMIDPITAALTILTAHIIQITGL